MSSRGSRDLPPSVVATTASGITAVAAVERSLDRAKTEADLNAFVTLDERGALEHADEIDRNSDLPLRGVTLAVKDNIHVAGLPNTAGTAALRNFVPEDSSPLIAKLQRLGAVVIGKAGLHELAYGITSINYAFGPVRNPIDPAKIAGGSSGGTAAAVAAGLVTAGIGTDTGGSIRLPAALTGLVGFRPSVGLYPSEGVTLISNTRDTIGLITQTVADAAILHGLIVDRPAATPRPSATLRLGVPRKHFREHLDPEVEDVFSKFLARLKKLGVELVEADMDDVPEANEAVSFPICLYETGQLLPEYLARNRTGVSFEQLIGEIQSPDVAAHFQAVAGGVISPEAYQDALRQGRPRLQQAYARYFSANRVDAVLFPTSPVVARDIEGLADGIWVNGTRQEVFQTYIRNTDPASNAGTPAISIPAGVTADGLPVGAEIECPAGQDDLLLSIALGLEESLNS